MAENWDAEEQDSNLPLVVNDISDPRYKTLTRRIDSLVNPPDEPRRYIGASGIGNLCERKIWYGYHGIAGEPISAKLLRTFEIGKRLEGMILDALESSGMMLERNQNNLGFIDPDLPEFHGHADALWLGKDEDVLIEIKTAKDSSFRIFERKGLREWNPNYYSQMQAYMGMSGINQGYLLALNKDTSELHDELIKFDSLHYADLRAKAQRIITATEAPERINNNPIFYICRGCQFKEICHA